MQTYIRLIANLNSNLKMSMKHSYNQLIKKETQQHNFHTIHVYNFTNCKLVQSIQILSFAEHVYYECTN